MTETEVIFATNGYNHLQARINHLEDVLAALLDDDNEATRADAQRALECS